MPERSDLAEVEFGDLDGGLKLYPRPEGDKFGRHQGNTAQLLRFDQAVQMLDLPPEKVLELIGFDLREIYFDTPDEVWIPMDDVEDYLYPESLKD